MYEGEVRCFLGMETLPGRDLHQEIYAYEYVRACLCCPLSPTNVIRYPILFDKGVDGMPEWKRMYLGRKAFNQEMAFSGNKKKAIILLASFFMFRRPPPEFKKFRRFHHALARLEKRIFQI
jgi:hypothetical protein